MRVSSLASATELTVWPVVITRLGILSHPSWRGSRSYDAGLSASTAAREEDRPAAVITTEDLLWDTSSMTQQDLDRAVGAWAAVLRSLGVPPDDALIRVHLEEGRGTHQGRERPTSSASRSRMRTS